MPWERINQPKAGIHDFEGHHILKVAKLHIEASLLVEETLEMNYIRCAFT